MELKHPSDLKVLCSYNMVETSHHRRIPPEQGRPRVAGRNGCVWFYCCVPPPPQSIRITHPDKHATHADRLCIRASLPQSRQPSPHNTGCIADTHNMVAGHTRRFELPCYHSSFPKKCCVQKNQTHSDVVHVRFSGCSNLVWGVEVPGLERWYIVSHREPDL